MMRDSPAWRGGVRRGEGETVRASAHRRTGRVARGSPLAQHWGWCRVYVPVAPRRLRPIPASATPHHATNL